MRGVWKAHIYAHMARINELKARIEELETDLRRRDETIKELREAERILEFDLIKEFEANGQTAHEDARYEARIPLKREYDPQKFLAVMGEILSLDQFKEVYSPSHVIEKTVPASVNGTKAKKLWDQGFKHDLEKTLLPGVRRLVIKLKKKETPL